MKTYYKNQTKRLALIFIGIIWAMMSFSATYYVSKTGNDLNNGTSELTPWLTLGKVNGFAFQPDDQVLFKGGDVWQAWTANNYRLTLAASAGTVGHPIVVSSYGNGMAEITGHGEIAGEDIPTGIWSEYSSGIWRLAMNYECNRLWINGKDSYKCQTLTLTLQSPWKWESGYLYIKSPSNPSTYYKSIRRSQNQNRPVYLSGTSNVTFQNIKVTGGSNPIRLVNSNNIIIEKCEIGYRTNSSGIGTYCTNGTTIDNIIIRNNKFITGDSLTYTYFKDPHTTGDGVGMGDGTTNCKVYNNYFHGWSHSAVYMNPTDPIYAFHDNEVYGNYITAPIIDYARGFNATTYSNGYNNSFHDNYIYDISVGNQFNSPNLKVYNNVIDGVRNQTYGGRKTGGHGIAISAQFVDAENMEIYNNTVMNCITAGFTFGGQVSNPAKSRISIHDNNFINNGWGEAAGVGYKFQMWFNGLANIDHVTISNNHMIGANADVVNYSSQENYSATPTSSLTVAEFNALPVVNSNTFSGNDSILTYNILGIGKFVTNINNFKIERNETDIPKIVSLPYPMIDLIGTKYSQSIILQPFTALLLLKDLTAAMPVTESSQTLILKKGYNMISTYVAAPDPAVNIVTQPIVADGNLIKIQDESGNSFENWGSFGGWINNLGSIQKTEGYKIKVAENCTLQVKGRLITLPLEITLNAGWNIISYPRTDALDAMMIVQSLIDQNKLIKVQDEAGNSIEDWGIYGGWKNGIGDFIPGKAYRVKMSASTVLTIQENYPKSANLPVYAEKTSYFSSQAEGNGVDHMNINLVGLKEAGLSDGDELAAFDGEICVGTLKITQSNLSSGSASLVASSTTGSQLKDGFKDGTSVQLYVWNQMNGLETKVEASAIKGSLIYQKNASILVKLKSLTTSTALPIVNILQTEVYPNPSQGQFTVRFSELPEAGSRIEVLDLSGRKVASRLITGISEELNLNGQAAGLYLVKSILGSSEKIQKLVLQ